MPQIASENFSIELFDLCANNDAGCYRLYVREPTGNCRVLSRFIGNDPQGTLYIGCGSNLRRRVGFLQSSIFARYGVHGYNDYWRHITGAKFTENIRAEVPLDYLYVDVFPLGPPALVGRPAHRAEEAILLRNYVLSYGELPPLNGWRWFRNWEGVIAPNAN